MKVYLLLLLLALVSRQASSFSPVARPLVQTNLFSREVMSEIDIMCISNAADLCSLYDECDIEEREGFLNRFEEQTNIMAERIATMQSLVKHLKTGDHLHLEPEEVESLKSKILDVAR